MRVASVALLGAISLTALMLFVPRVPQWQSYHQFADTRELISGIPNSLNVLSNLTFLLTGAAGLFALKGRVTFVSQFERIDTFAFFIATMLTAFGSTVYHLRPNDRTLIYDRLGIAVVVMALLAMIVHARIEDSGWLFPFLVIIGAASIVWWRAYDDLRLYGWVQYFPAIAIILLLVPARTYSGETAAIASIGVAYALAKVFELTDRAIYEALEHVVSGHTLKHIAASAAPLIMARWIARRNPTSPFRPPHPSDRTTATRD